MASISKTAKVELVQMLLPLLRLHPAAIAHKGCMQQTAVPDRSGQHHAAISSDINADSVVQSL